MTRPLLALLLCLAALPAAAQDSTEQPAEQPTEQPQAEAPEQTPEASEQEARIRNNPIVARMSEFVAAYDAGNAGAIAGLYTDDAALLPPQGNSVIGRPAITAHYAAAFEAGATNMTINIQEIRQHGPSSAVEIGNLQIDLPDAVVTGRYLHVWALTDSGWLLSRDMYQILSANPKPEAGDQPAEE